MNDLIHAAIETIVMTSVVTPKLYHLREGDLLFTQVTRIEKIYYTTGKFRKKRTETWKSFTAIFEPYHPIDNDGMPTPEIDIFVHNIQIAPKY